MIGSPPVGMDIPDWREILAAPMDKIAHFSLATAGVPLRSA